MKSLLQNIPVTLRPAQGERGKERIWKESPFMLSLPVLSEVEGSKHRHRFLSSLNNFGRVLLTTAALLALPADFVAAASLDESLADRKPEASIDLATREGTQLVKGEWRYGDTKIVEVDFKAAGPDGQPSTIPNKAYDFTPHAGGADFNDSKWEVIAPTTLDTRRS